MCKAAILGAAMTAAGVIAAPALAQDADQPVPCSTEEYRQMDFWVGTWDALWVDAEGVEQRGSNTVSSQLNGCMIFEEFDGRPGSPFLGRSMSQYVGQLGVWKQVWMDSAGGYIPLTGGQSGDEFMLSVDRGSEATPYFRMVFTNINQDSFDWHWQQSQDEGETWEDQWHIMYSRR